MERNKRAADLADKPNLFLDPCSSAGLAAISLTAFIPIIHLIALILLNARYPAHATQLTTAQLTLPTQEIRCGDYLPDPIAERAFGNMSWRRADFTFRLDGKLTRKSLPGN
jgi:hypothetical protein